MKRIAFVFVLFVGVLISSCEGPMGPQGPQGIPGEDGTSWFIRNISINWNDWMEESDATGPYLYYEINEPRLTRSVLNQCLMETYYCYRLSADDNVRYVPLSYSDFWSDKEEYFTVEYTIGQITIIYKNSTGTEGPEFDTYDFQTRVMW